MNLVDPFDLPEWLGTTEVTWHALNTDRGGHLIHGRLSGAGGREVPCNLLAVDQAWPTAIADNPLRQRVHLAWRNGEVELVEVDGELTLLAPGAGFSSGLVMEALERLVRAVGAHPEQYVAAIRLGALVADE